MYYYNSDNLEQVQLDCLLSQVAVVETSYEELRWAFLLGLEVVMVWPRHKSQGTQHIWKWIGLGENLQETIDFPIKYGTFLYIFP